MLIVEVQRTMKRPEALTLRREDGEALRTRLDSEALTTADRRRLGPVLAWYFGRVLTLQAAKLSLKRLRALVFGVPPNKPKEGPSSPGPGDAGAAAAGGGATTTPGATTTTARPRQGHGRQSAEAYGGATLRVCRPEELAVGERCPVCGRGRLSRSAPGGELRLDGTALWSAVRYAVEKLRGSACGPIFSGPLPGEARGEKYRARARAVLASSRYDRGIPWYRLAGYQALVGGPVAEATPWEQMERVADCASPVFAHLQPLAAPGEVISPDDTHVRILSLLAEHRQAAAPESAPQGRTGMHPTALVAAPGAQTIVLYCAGRAHAGENLAPLFTQREAAHGKPIVLSEARAATAAEETGLSRCHGLAHGRRKCTEIADRCPAACPVVLEALGQGLDHEAAARRQPRSATERLASPQRDSGPILDGLKPWRAQPFAQRTVEPNSRLGKACRSRLTHGPRLTRVLEVPGAPREHNTAERAVKLAIRQRKNSVLYASAQRAYGARRLTSLLATGLHAGVHALASLVALQAHRSAVCRPPAAGLPWN